MLIIKSVYDQSYDITHFTDAFENVYPQEIYIFMNLVILFANFVESLSPLLPNMNFTFIVGQFLNISKLSDSLLLSPKVLLMFVT